MLDYSPLETFARDVHSSVWSPFVSYDENEVELVKYNVFRINSEKGRTLGTTKERSRFLNFAKIASGRGSNPGSPSASTLSHSGYSYFQKT